MARRFRIRFRLFILSVALAGELPMAFLLAALLRPWVPEPRPIAFGLCALAFVPFFLRVQRGMGDQAESGWLRPLVFAFYAFWAASLCAGIYYLPFALLAWAFKLPGTWAVATALAIGTLLGLLGVTWWRMRPRFSRIDIPIPDLAPALDGYRIAQLTDLHVGAHTPPERLRAWVDRVNALDVDLVAVTGDLITSGDAYVHAAARELGRLRGRDGVGLCLGNHDYFTDAEAFVRALTAEGLDVLRNRGRVIGQGERRLYLAGVDDTWQRRHDVAQALADRPPELPSILLAHDPVLFPAAAALGATLVLSGHTHGGQVALPLWPRVFNAARLAYRYTAGLYRQDSSHLYVCRGAGTTGLPLRVGASAEIAILTLRRSPP
ncbi:MAG TPA: metallophosphoesterase [Polyangia bacterium]|nr:metallophosphoesterase [Polyangia bacterium]